MGIAIWEQETVINFSRDGNECTIWTSDSTVMTRLDRLVKNEPDWELIHVNKVENKISDKLYKTKKSLVSFRGHKTTKTMTDEQRAAASERLKKSRQKIKENNEDG